MWYELEEGQRLHEVYSKCTLEQFWNWWSSGNEQWMEIRTRDWKDAKELGTRLGVPFSVSGVYVNNFVDFKNAVVLGRQYNIQAMFNPRKYAVNKYGVKTIGGDDYHVDAIQFICIDFDRLIKESPATLLELQKADSAAQEVLTQLDTRKWAENYCKICSGNGVQLLIKLDVPINMPTPSFNTTTKVYEDYKEFDKLKHIYKKFCSDLLRFARKKKFRETYGVELDVASFHIGAGFALPYTKNFKYDGFRWRGIVELKEGTNEGLSDYLVETLVNVVPQKTTQNIVSHIYKINKENVYGNKLVKFMVESRLPTGGRNNYVWFMLKCLMRDSGLDFASDVVRQLHKKVEDVQKDKYTLSVPAAQYTFSPDVVNMYCMSHNIPPLYKIRENKQLKQSYKLDDVEDMVDDWEFGTPQRKLPDDTNIIEDIKIFKGELRENDYMNRMRYVDFINACAQKYGYEQTTYFMRHIMNRLINYS